MEGIYNDITPIIDVHIKNEKIMRCPACQSSKISYETTEKNNNGTRFLQAVGAGALAVGGMIALPIPGLRYVGLGCFGGAMTLVKGRSPKQTTRTYKCVCSACGHKWEKSEIVY